MSDKPMGEEFHEEDITFLEINRHIQILKDEINLKLNELANYEDKQLNNDTYNIIKKIRKDLLVLMNRYSSNMSKLDEIGCNTDSERKIYDETRERIVNYFRYFEKFESYNNVKKV